jgi:hypothetical protein
MTIFRNFSREYKTEKQPAKLDCRRRTFGFVGLARGAGATTLAQSFAYFLREEIGERISYTEISSGNEIADMPYDKIGLDLRGGENFDEGILWNLRKFAEEKECLTVSSCARLMLAPKTNFAVFDIESNVCDNAEIAEVVFPNLDDIVVAVDPLPSRMINMRERLLYFKELELAGRRVTYMLNKMNSGVLRNELRDFLGIRKPIEIPMLPPEKIYSSEFNCLPIIQDKAMREKISEPFKTILNHRL